MCNESIFFTKSSWNFFDVILAIWLADSAIPHFIKNSRDFVMIEFRGTLLEASDAATVF